MKGKEPMKQRKITLVIILLTLLLAACGGAGAGSEDQALSAQTWVLATYNGTASIPGHQPTLQFENGQVSGSTGCNHYGGSYQAKGDALRFEGLYSTEMACLEPAGLMEQESGYLATLGQVDRYEVAGGALMLYAQSQPVLVFELQTEEPVAVETETTSTEVAPTEEAYPGPASTEPAVEEAAATATSTPTIPAYQPPEGFNPYQDPTSGITVYIPAGWIVTGIIEGDFAILQSYPEDKYVGGEARQAGDTKCDLNLQPGVSGVEELVANWGSDSMTTIVSETPFELASGAPAWRFEINSMGPAITYAAQIDGRLVLLTCFGDFSRVDEIAVTLRRDE